MAGTTTTSRDVGGEPGSTRRDHMLQHQKVITDLEMVRRVLSVTHAAVANSTTVETDLMTYTLVANQLSAVFAAIRVKVWGSTTNNANVKTLKVYWNGVAIHTVTLTASQAGRWVCELQIIKTGASTQDWVSEIYEAIATLAAGKGAEDVGTATATDTGAIIVKVTGTSGTASSDITAEGMIVEYLPVAGDLIAAKIGDLSAAAITV